MGWGSLITRRSLLVKSSAVLLTRFFHGGGAPSYQGLGDIYGAGAAVGYWGLRAFDAVAASSGMKAIQLQRASDSAVQDIAVLSNGSLDLAAATTFLSGTTGGISIWYDQSGNGYHHIQATAAMQPQFTFNALGALPAISFNPLNQTLVEYAAGIPDVNVPAVFSHVVKPTITGTTAVFFMFQDSVNGGNQSYAFDGFGNPIYLADFGGDQNVFSLMTNNNWHYGNTSYDIGAGGINMLFDNVLHTFTFSGTTPNPLLRGPNSIGCDINGVSLYQEFFNGLVFEVGVWATSALPSRLSAGYSNQQRYAS